MSGQTTVTVTLIVKGESDAALKEVERRIGESLYRWFVEDIHAPFPEGALLWYRVADAEAEKELEDEDVDEAPVS